MLHEAVRSESFRHCVSPTRAVSFHQLFIDGLLNCFAELICELLASEGILTTARRGCGRNVPAPVVVDGDDGADHRGWATGR